MKNALEQYHKSNDKNLYYEACVAMMDDEIREDLNIHLDCDSDEEFLAAYCQAHFEKYNEDFIVN
jgi:hypothetical protein